MSVFGGAASPRQQLGLALQRLRRDAELTGAELGDRLGVAQSTISRLENGRQLPSPDQVDRWAAATGAAAARHRELDELAEQAATEAVAWRRRSLAAMQHDTADLEGSAGLIRTYHPVMVHSLLQVPEYARAVYQARARLDGRTDSEVAEAVAARMGKQALLYKQGHRFEFLLTEAGLAWRFVPADVMAAQLDRLDQLSRLPNVLLGVLPLAVEAPVWRWESFTAFLHRADDLEDLVHVETLSTGLSVRNPVDVGRHLEAFDQLAKVAATGDAARALLARLAAEL